VSPRTKGYPYNGPCGQIQMHSSWEVKVARVFDDLGLTWTYEPELFRTSAGGYVPDFWIEEAQCFVEVKGYATAYALGKLTAFVAENPDKELLVIRDIGFIGMVFMVQRIYQLCLGIKYNGLTDAMRVEHIRRNVLRMYQEVGELLEAAPWKWHRVYDNDDINVGNLAEEFGDLFVFALNVLAVAGLQESDIMDAVHAVHLKNFARLREGTNKKEM